MGHHRSVIGVTECAIPKKDNFCIDIDECSEGGHDCKLENGSCENTVGSWECHCDPGYEKQADGTCESVDECTTGSHNCHEFSTTCNNLDGNAGGYECTCKPGFEKDPNNDFACKDVDECNPSNDDLKPCNIMHGSCENTQASFQTAPCKRDSCSFNQIPMSAIVSITLKAFTRETTFVSAKMDSNLAKCRIRLLTSFKIALTSTNVLKTKESFKNS